MAGVDLTGLDAIPEARGLELFVTSDGIPGPLSTGGEGPSADGTTENRTGWRRPSVLVSAVEEDDGAQQKQEGGKQVRQPEADVLKAK